MNKLGQEQVYSFLGIYVCNSHIGVPLLTSNILRNLINIRMQVYMLGQGGYPAQV